MAYIGNPPADRYSAVSYQDLTGGTGTSFTLDYAVGSANEIEVFVNNVRQEPSVAYTVSGDQLTMTGSIASTDDFYVVFQGKAQQTVTHPATHALEATDGTFTGDLTVDTNTLYVDSASNRVGIRTSSPTHRLTVSGTNNGEHLVVTGGNIDRGLLVSTFNSGRNDDGVNFDAVGTNGTLTFSTAGTERLRMLSSGGITFNGDTASANALDDYEEGTWTPVADRGITSFTTAATYSVQEGHYVKIGKVVVATFTLRFSNNPSGGSGSPVLTGFPFSMNDSLIQGVAVGLDSAISGATFVYTDALERVIFNSASYTSDPNLDYLTGTVIYVTN